MKKKVEIREIQPGLNNNHFGSHTYLFKKTDLGLRNKWGITM